MEYIIILIILFFVEYLLFSNRKKEIFIELLRYMLCSTIIIFLYFFLSNILNNTILIIILLVIKFLLDFFFVFKKISFKVTDWKKYYSKKCWKIVEKKRQINIDYITNVLKMFDFKGGNVIEYGGGNSRVAEAISEQFIVKKFTIVDSNEYGIKLLKNRKIKNLKTNCISIFDYKDHQKYDLGYSIGLIEHFQNKDLIKCINAHFKFIKPGGYVLFTFPVPTLKYRIIRTIYEVFNMWQFTDEVALNTKQVESIVKKNHVILHSSINKKLILPQGIMLIKRQNEK